MRKCSTAEPVAVIGMSCRLPRADGPDRFWDLLRSGTDAVSTVPAQRWDDAGAPGHRRGGFLDHVDRFDAAFFGISPAEATAMDPQQRLVLELAWEALEQSRTAPTALRGSRGGVFVGAINNDYAAVADRLGAAGQGPHTFTGLHRGLIANRVSYLLGLRGPSLTVDAGQCSSLLAVQLACESLLSGDTTLAIAGGVNLNLVPETSEVIGRFGALSPTGHCHTLDRRADGYVRGEGGGLVVLKPLAAALADGDPVHCVILGGAVNNDGGGAGLTVPDGDAQQDVVRLACRRAGVDPGQVRYVELHGTGTRVGDPIEAAALGAVLGAGRPAADPLLVGSVKTNIGHLEGAAGIAGLLKVVLSLRHRTLVGDPGFTGPAPTVPLAELGIDVVRSTREWPDGPLLAGVSSFGIGGTNCHLVLGAAPAEEPGAARPASDAPWVLSARTPAALRAQADAVARHVTAHPDVRDGDVALSLAATRTAFEHRAVVLGGDRADRLAGLAALAAGRPDAAVVTGRTTAGTCAFVFPGQGSQWPGMARELLADSPVFARRLTECADALAPFADHSLLDVLREAPGAPGLDRVDVVQPALWAVMVALAEVWRAHGVEPAVVVGHSQGEIAAATVSGALTLTDGARVVALRSRAIASLRGGRGGMMSVGASPAAVAAALAAVPDVTVAAVNGPASIVLSGPRESLLALRRELDAAGHRTKVLPVDYASHSPAVDALREDLLAALAPVAPVSTAVPFVSTLTGEPIDTARLDATYWFDGLRGAVRFADATRWALRLGASVFVEVSPHPVLVGGIEAVVEDVGADAVALGTLRRDDGGTGRVRHGVAAAWAAGADAGWDHDGARRVDLPTYPFQRERFWLDGTARRPAPVPAAVDTDAVQAPAAPIGSTTRAAVRELVAGAAAAVLGFRDPGRIERNRSFKDSGLDSAGSVELRNHLQTQTGLRLPTTLTYDFPTPAALAEHLFGVLGGTAGDAGTAVSRPTGAPDDDPVAIVSIGCRYPGGVRSPQDLWRLVESGTDAISGFPRNRGWDLDTLLGGPARPGTCVGDHGGFLHDADAFDAAFFGLSPREALGTDPQQRLLLETSWEALERAGIDPAGLAGTATGVFVGAMTGSYGPPLHRPTGAADGHLLTGTALSVASGRIAYTLGLHGPAITVDTACSSSLVAIGLATRALRAGECTLALAGGVTLMASPGNLVEFTRQNGLAPDGRAKAFADGADGTAFAEGAGMLLLERLSDARRLGHPVLALVRGVAVNSDGASNGLTAPSGRAQEEVIRQALADARLDTGDVDAVEAHGTGTALGDPIEANALVATYGRGRAAGRPVWLGSVKSNIGHAQAAAGVAGVVKMVLAMHHGVLPRTLHADAPTGAVDWDGGGVALLTAARPWPVTDRPRRAAVSGFGISGTNAHVVLEAAPEPGPVAAGPGGPLVWVLSARSDTALRTHAAELGAFAAAATDTDLVAAAPLLARRSAFAHRAVVVAGDRAELAAALGALAADGEHPALAHGTAAGGVTPVFVFPGQGGQWPGMAADLVAQDPVFAGYLRECDDALRPHTGWSVLDVLAGTAGAPALTGSPVVQPVLFALMVALARSWRSVGVEPAAVLGHSQGEIAAACVAGALTLDDAARVVALRSRVLSALDGTGGVLSVALPAAEVTARLEPWTDRLWLAVDNGPAGTVIAGDLDAVAEFEAAWGGSVLLRRTALDYASHTPHVAAVREEMLATIGPVTPVDTDVAICASGTGGFVDGSSLDTGYWYRNLAGRVRFDAAVRAFADRPAPLFVEVGPHPVLTAAVLDILDDAAITGGAVPTLRRGDSSRQRFLRAAAQAFVRGAAVRWTAVTGPLRGAADLPTYPFERSRFWLDGDRPDGAGPGGAPAHPLLDVAVAVADGGGLLLTGRLSPTAAPWLADHTIGDTVLLPGTAFVELALAAGAAAGAGTVEDLTVLAPLPLTGPVHVQVSVGGADEHSTRTVAIHSAPVGPTPAGGDPEWVRHATGLLGPDAGPAPADLGSWPPPGAVPIDLGGAYERLAAAGYRYGPAFRGLVAAWRDGEDRWAEVALPAGVAPSTFAVHPALLDAALHPLVLDAPGPRTALPFSFTGVRVAAHGADRLRVRITGGDEASVELFDLAGRSVGGIGALVLREAAGPVAPGLHDLRWVPDGTAVSDSTAPDGTAVSDAGRDTWAVLGCDPRAQDAVDALRDAGVTAPLHYETASLTDTGPVPGVVVLPHLPDADDAAEDPAHAVGEGLGEVLDVVQQWVADERFAASRLVLLADPGSLTGAPVWGLLRSAMTEHPGRFVLAHAGDGEPWAPLVAAVAAGRTQFVVRDGQVLVPELTRRPAADPDAADPDSTAPDTTAPAAPRDALATGTVLVTGGTGGLGALVAAHLVTRHGVRDLLLTSRRGPDAPGAAEQAEHLRGLGATVRVVACDVTDRRALTTLVGGIDPGRPLVAVVHAAGVLADSTVAGLGPDRLDAVLRPKVEAGWLLHELTRDLPLRAFVLFSSVAGVLGTAGQAGYAAANAFLDALAGHRHDLGLAGVSIAWGPWDTAGMTAGLAAVDGSRLGAQGVAALTAEAGLALLDDVLTDVLTDVPAGPGAGVPGRATPVAALWDRDALRGNAAQASVVLRRLVPAPRGPVDRPAPARDAGTPPVAAPATATLAGRLAGLDRADARTVVLDLVRSHVATALGHGSPEGVRPDVAFTELGFDSLTAVELRNRLGAATGLRLTPTLVFNQPNVTALAEHLLAELAPPPPPADDVLRLALEQVDATLAGGGPDDVERVVEVLRAAVARLSGPREDDPPAPLDTGVSDEDLFRFIDTQL